MKISVFVVSYNRQNIIEACVSALDFADEVILVDKSSTDKTCEFAAPWVDRIVTVPWSPVPGETFAYGLSLCKHDWVIPLSDDECLNLRAIEFIKNEVQNPRADVYYIPRQDYVLGRFDERAYYWPQWHPQLYRRQSFEYGKTIHGAPHPLSSNQYRIPIESGVAVVHLSHEDTAEWIEKTNRYTSQVDRLRMYLDPSTGLLPFVEPGGDLRGFAHQAIDFWAAQSPDRDDNYSLRVALLRALYDIIDHIKHLEERDGVDGQELFRVRATEMIRQYEAYYGRTRRRGGVTGEAPVARTGSTNGAAISDASQVERLAAELHAARETIELMRRSRSWRLTLPLRLIGLAARNRKTANGSAAPKA